MITLVNWNAVKSTKLKKLATGLFLLQLIAHCSSAFASISTHKANLLEVATKTNLRSSARGFYHRKYSIHGYIPYQKK